MVSKNACIDHVHILRSLYNNIMNLSKEQHFMNSNVNFIIPIYIQNIFKKNSNLPPFNSDSTLTS